MSRSNCLCIVLTIRQIRSLLALRHVSGLSACRVTKCLLLTVRSTSASLMLIAQGKQQNYLAFTLIATDTKIM